jgi:hypothetical protein
MNFFITWASWAVKDAEGNTDFKNIKGIVSQDGLSTETIGV